MAYNLTNLTDSNNTLQVAVAVDQISGGLFFNVILFAILIIMFVRLSVFGAQQAFMTSSFVTFILASILWAVGVLAEGTLIISFVLMIVAGLVYYTTSQ